VQLCSSFPQPIWVLPVVEHRNDDDIFTLDEIINAVELETADRRPTHIAEAQTIPKRVVTDFRNRLINPIKKFETEAELLFFVPSGPRRQLQLRPVAAF
jgi:hypothetical protein